VTEGSNEQTYLVFRDGRGDVEPATEIRSTLIMSSQQTLRDAGVFEEYEAHLDPAHRHAILETSAPKWLEIEVGLAHYRACDALGLGANRVAEMAQGMSMRRRGTFLGVAVGLASGIGVTPWTVLGQADRVWRRAWVGGGIAGHKIADKEARIEVAGWPCAKIPYCRHALRGLLLGVATLLAPQSSMHEIQALQRDNALAFRLSWR